MLKFCPFYSSSDGNSIYVESDKAKILVDVGVSYKKLNEALIAINDDIANINAIFITHSHSDHCKALKMITARYNIPIYATKGTLDALDFAEGFNNIHDIENNDIILDDLIISSFPTPHDTEMSCGFVVRNAEKKLTIATDLGYINEELLSKMSGSNLVYIESNHDVEMLKAGRYPFETKRRILGDHGHLSNEACGQAICILAKEGINNFILAHLSKENNVPELALQTVLSCLLCQNIETNNLNITVASRTLNSDVVVI